MRDDISTRRDVLKLAIGGAAGVSLAATAATGTAAASSTPPGVKSMEAESGCNTVHYTYEEFSRVIRQDRYEAKSPVNVFAKGYDVEDIHRMAENDSDWRTRANHEICEYSRYVFNQEEGYMMGPDRHPNDGYAVITKATDDAADEDEAASGCDASGKRYHARCYEIEDGIVAISAHEDSQDHDSGVASYQSAEEEVIDLIHSNSDDPHVSYQDLDNSKGDHDGTATVIWGSQDSITISC